MSAHAGPIDAARGGLAASATLTRAGGSAAWTAVGVAAVLSGICFAGGGGLALDSQVPVEMSLTLGACGSEPDGMGTGRSGPSPTRR
ncbi:MAG: hypothetical protein LC720_01470 [Actinobacteria bacterium]|nr:hypothetical protein [Actinomycetota bacterium]